MSIKIVLEIVPKTTNVGQQSTLDSGINVGVRLLILGLFSNGYVLIKGGMIINFFIFYFLDIFFACFTLAMYKKINLSVILRGGYAYSMGYVYCFCKKFQGLRLFKGVRLFRSLEYFTLVIQYVNSE